MANLRILAPILETKLRKMLQDHGDFKNVEIAIARYHEQKERDGKRGRWVTKAYLMEVQKYTK